MPRYLLLILGWLVTSPLWAAGEKLPVWQVRSDTARVVLLGSMHMAYPDIYPLRAEIEAAFAAADTLVVEVDISGSNAFYIQQLMLEKGMLPPGDSLDRYVSEQTWLKLQDYLFRQGLPQELFSRLRPGLAVTTLTSMRLAELGMQAEWGIDRHFLTRADEDMEVLELETIEQQIDLLLSFPEPDLLLSQALLQLDSIDLYLRPLYDAWRAGDELLLNRLLLEDERQRNPQFLPVYEKFFDERNRAMADKISGFLRGNGRYFVVVGAGHLVGREGIIALLERQGYTAQRL